MHVADLTQNFELNCTFEQRQQRRVELLKERFVGFFESDRAEQM